MKASESKIKHCGYCGKVITECVNGTDHPPLEIQARDWLISHGNEAALDINGLLNSMTAFAEHLLAGQRQRIKELEAQGK